MMSESIWNDPRITAYALGELPDDEKEQFEAELATNTELVAAVAEVQSLTEQLQTHFTQEPIPGLDVARRKAILAQPSPAESADRSARRSWFSQHGMQLAIAASILFVMVGLVLPGSKVVIEATRQNDNRVAMEIQDEAMVEQAGASPDGSAMGSRDAAPASGTQAMPIAKPAPAPSSPSPFEAKAELQNSLAVPAPAPKLSARDLWATKSSDEFRKSMPEMRPSSHAQLTDEPVRTATDNFGMGMGGYADESGMSGGAMDGMGMGMMGMGMEAQPIAGDFAVAPVPESGALIDRQTLETNRRRMERSQLLETNPSIADPPDIKAVPRDNQVQLMVTPRIIIQQEEEKAQTGAMDDLFVDLTPEGRGPGISGDQFEPITDNAFQRVSEHPLSTFSADVDTASYSKVRDFLVRANQLPRPDAVRIEEMLNYFDYNYAPPASDSQHPFAAHAEIVSCPWNDSHRLARIAVKGKTVSAEDRPACNLVFLLDTSGSMDAPNKAPLVQEGMKMLLSQLSDKDRVAIVVYAGSAGLVLDSTPASKDKKIRRSLTQLAAGGSTNGGAGIALAYQTARDHFIQDGVNRVILCTDGDFNVGVTGTDSLVRMVETEAKGGVFLTVLGFGMGNHNDAMLEQISGRGNGNYAFIDTVNEAKKVLVEQTESTLVTIAKDVKFQVEFNPMHVSAYRLIGYENRMLAKEDFNDDKKDAGEIGAGHTVTALYEIVPAGVEVDAVAPEVDALKYQKKLKPTEAANSDETLTVKLRYKAPDGDTSTLVDFPVVDAEKSFTEADEDVRFAAAVAGFGMKLRRSEYAGTWTLADVEKVAESAKGSDRFGLRAEFLELVRKAAAL